MKKIFKNIAIVLILFALSSFFSSCQNGDKAYNDAIKTRFQQVEETLTKRLYENTNYVNWTNREITHIRFLETEKESANIQVYYEGVLDNPWGITEIKSYARFDMLLDYYNTLIEAETSGNVLYYLDALNKIFKNMTFVEEVKAPYIIDFKLRDFSEATAFNDIFNLNDIENENIVRQVGFLPYHIEVVDYHYNEETFLNEYTYKICGISYCETKSKSYDSIKRNEDLILESGYNKNHIKVFQRDILYSSTRYYEGGVSLDSRLKGDFRAIIEGVNNPYTVETVFFKEYDLLKIYDQIKEGNINFKKPKDFNVKEYLENIK